jgi:hypothetical protein
MRAAAHISAAVALAAGGAWADGISGLLDETYSHTRSRISEGGFDQTSVADQLVQRYRLALDRSFFPALRFTGGGTFEQYNARGDTGGLSSELNSRTASVFGNLVVGNPFLSAAGAYQRREQTAGTTTTPFGFVSEDMSLLLSWRPTDLPIFSLRLARPSLRDRDRQIQDITTNQALFSVVYDPIRQLDLRYSLDYQNPIDRLHDTDLRTISQAARVIFDDRLLGGRSTVSFSANLLSRQVEVAQSGAGGTTQTLLAPVAGYSLVEALPARPALDSLVQNGALINGDTIASAGIDLGVAPSQAGDTANRDVGVQFADTVTRVNTFWLWVDRQLPEDLAARIQWTVWKSDDNLNWTQIALATPPLPARSVVFNAFVPRFEISIPETQARYLKLVAQPLPVGSTTDPAFRNLFVTEMQTLLIVAAPAARGWQSSTGAVFSASARTQLTPTPLLSHDLSVFVTRGERAGVSAQSTWVIANGLSLSKKLGELLLLSARVARQDADQSRGHEGQWLYSASLGATPLPTLTGSFVYSGRIDTSALGTTATNGVSLFAQAIPYRGIGLLGSLSLGITALPTGQDSRFNSLTFTATAQPHQKLTLAGTFVQSASVTTGGGLPRSSSTSSRVEGTATFNPVRALFLSGNVSRTITQPRPINLANGTIGFSPFPGGDLQLSVTYTQSLEADTSVNRLFTPSIRWNVRRATLTASWSMLDREGPLQSNRTRRFDINLRTPL